MYRNFKNRVLLVYPNMPLSYLAPTNIAMLAACLKQAGFEVKVFDTTFYKTQESEMEKRIEYGHYKQSKQIEYKKSNVYDDFQALVDLFKPNVIGVSTVDATFDLGLKLIQNVKHNAHIIFGGVYPTFNPKKVLSYKEIDSICVGEGEDALVELCEHIRDDKEIITIRNIWTERTGTPLRPYVDINTLPYEDFHIFPEENLYRPMQGKLKKMLPVMIDRGCPFNCTFCAEPSLRKLYRTSSSCRIKSMNNIKMYLRHMVNNYKPDYLYFNTETFFARPEEHIKQLAEFYKEEIKLPFCCMTRFDTMTFERVKLLKDMNCDRVSFGLEHGNPDFRKNILNKNITQGDVFDTINMLNNFNIGASVFCIIGFPGETEKLIWETIDTCKIIKALHKDVTFSVSVFQPYSSASLTQECIDRGYIKPGTKCNGLISESVLNMPQLSEERINWFAKHFIELID